MIKIYKNTDDDSILKEINNIEKDCWINLVNPTSEELKQVTKAVKIEERLLKEVLVEKDLPRIKKVDEGILIVIDIPYKTQYKYNTYPLGIIFCNDAHFITVSLKDTKLLNKFANNEITNFYTAKKSRFCIQILGETANEYEKVLKEIDSYIENKENQMLNATSNKQLIGLLNIQKSLVYFITSLKHNNTVLEKISKEYVIDIYKEDLEFLEDTIIDVKQSIEMCNIYREILNSTIETYGTVTSNNLNVAMRFLAGITIVFSIPTMLASFFGMNVPLGFWAHNPYSFLIISCISIVVAIIIAIWLKGKKMF